jgi:hypothetical protein
MSPLRLVVAWGLALAGLLWAVGSTSEAQRWSGLALLLAWALVALEPAFVRGRLLGALALTGLLAVPLGPGFVTVGALLAAPWGAQRGARAWRRLQFRVRGSP